MERKEDLWENELWTQNEVAEYFRVVPGTVYNWRKQGQLAYFQAPGSSRVLFYRDDVIRFRDSNSITKKGGDKKRKPKPIKGKPDLSATHNKKWRI